MFRLLFRLHKLIVVLLTFARSQSQEQDCGADSQRSIYDLAKSHGYPLETHEVQTEDGYLLTLHRISNNKTTQVQKTPIFLMHPLLATSIAWINFGPGKSLAYLLSDLGYDVWMGNNRGNSYSRKHVSIDAEKNPEKFFNFSFHEIGFYDLPASVDYILNQTKEEDLIYIGHSQGTTAFFVMAAEKPEYNKKIRLMIALAPVVYMKNIPNPIFQMVAKYIELIKILVDKLHIYEFLPHNKFTTDISCAICIAGGEFQHFCPWFIGVLAGFDDQIEPDLIPAITSSIPAGSSVKQLFHYSQEINSGQFCQYDYGSSANLIQYGSENPPLYNLSRISAPVALYYGENDFFSAVEDVQHLSQDLPNVLLNKAVPYENFNHLDFLWARDVVKLLYNDIVAVIKSKSD